MSHDLGVLLIGAGRYGAVHASAIAAAAGLRLAGVVDRHGATAQELADRWGVAWWADLDVALRRSGADVAAVVVPTAQHAGVVLEALGAGLDVLVEKPVCLDPADVVRLEEAARLQGRIIDVVSQRRFQSGIYAAKRALDAGALGRITSAQCDTSVWRSVSYFTEARWRGDAHSGGGNLLNHGMHALDLLLWLLGNAREVSAWRADSRVPGVTVEEVLVALLRFDDVLATLHASVASYPGERMRLTVTGEKGTLDVDDGSCTLVHLDDVTGEIVRRSWESADPDTALRAQYEDLVPVAGGQKPPRVGLDAGAHALHVASALLASAEGGGMTRKVAPAHASTMSPAR